TPILEDPETSSPTAAPQPETRRLSVAEFRTAHAAYGRRSLCGGLLVLCLVWVPVFLVGCWETPLHELLGSPAFEVLLVAALILGACLALVAAAGGARLLRRQLHINCPHCGESLFHPTGIVIATRRCHHCGRRALDEEPSPSA